MPSSECSIADALRKRDIPFTYLKGTKDIWCRDYMPIQIQKDRFVFYRYTPDYLQDKTGLTLQTNPELVFQEESNELPRLLPMSVEETGYSIHLSERNKRHLVPRFYAHPNREG